MTYDIFISYKRRDTSSAIAALVYNYLSQKGYKVFFDRKEIRQGRFNEQLYNHIEAAKDIIILLEETSLRACFSEITDAYKTDWFCKEVMHALELERDKHIIPILLGGYQMPDSDQLPEELKLLPLQNAISLDASEMDEVFQKYFISQGYLQSKPQEKIPGTNISIENGEGISDFLFYTTNDCDIYECGEKMLSLSSENDEEHPYRYSVKRSGEHRFHCINNDTCEIIKVIESIETGGQKYIELKWTKAQNLWELTEEEINSQNDANILYEWGNGLFWGTTTHQPDLERAFICLSKSALYDNESARSFFANEYVALFDRELPSEAILPWLERASEFGSTKAKLSLANFYSGLDDEKSVAVCTEAANEGDVNAMHHLGVIYYYGDQGVKVNPELSIEWFNKAIEKGDVTSMCRLGNAYERGDVIPKNDVKAAQLYQLAVDNGSKTALTMLGNCYREGIGVEQNKEKAVELYKKAVELESGKMDEVDPWSQYIMGLCFSSGTGVEKDESKALEWFYKAARGGEGDIDAMFQIGCFNFFGKATEQNYKQAFHWFSLAEQGGDSDSCLFLGYMYNDGLYVEQDFTKALDFFQKAAEADIPQAMREIGFIYFDGKGVEKDLAAAVEWFRKGGELGEPNCQRMTALSYAIYCTSEEQDLTAAINWFDLSAQKEDVVSLCYLGDIYSHRWPLFRDLIPEDMEKAFAYYLRAAECEFPKAQYLIGRLYEYQNRENFEPEYEKAISWYEKAAENDYLPAYRALGYCYLSGKGVEKDESKALEWFYKAARDGEGDIDAMFQIGRFNFYGKATEQNYKQAFHWFSLAEEGGDPDSSLFLGYMYNDGLYVEQDFTKALGFFQKAAEAGTPQAMGELGYIYYNGQGVEKDLPLAVEWFRKGAELGEPYAQRMTAYSYTDFCPKEEQDLNAAIYWFELAAKQKDVDSLYKLGEIYSHRWPLFRIVVPKNIEKAVAYYMEAAECGYPKAQFQIGRLYEYQDEKNFEPDYERALFWFEKAAENNYVQAYEVIGDMYSYGQGVEQSEEKALEWKCKAIENGHFISAAYYDGRFKDGVPSQIIDALIKASQNGYKDAKNYLAQLYLSGKAKCEDPKVALDIFTEAANEGNLESKYQLALLYLQKHYPLHKYYVNHDIQKAKNLLTSLVDIYEENPYLDNGELPACVKGAYYNLGKMYLSGSCVPKDESIALEHFKKAATNGAHLALVEIVKIQKKRFKNIADFYKPMSNKELLDYALSCFKEACEEMSRRYREGDRENKDEKNAQYWHLKAIGKIGRKTLKQRIISIFSKGILNSSNFEEPQKWFWQK